MAFYEAIIANLYDDEAPAGDNPFGKLLISGEWKTIDSVSILVSGEWKEVFEIKINIDSSWKDLSL